ncbi:type I polyketide synthase [Sinosporangium siamense]|uniref:Uncharacterized protein n=1 Tax=Sinosporangium siamense TaxID=1367973 RepID=A0A919RMQ9_9ACTN|nr:type I polyketide synthase [Sinosporangium siamense]GII96413.1 hypothetical protein Ssi02_66440 [Sinosporangium siamense]
MPDSPDDRTEFLRGLTLPAVFQTAADTAPDAVALIDGDRSWTWREWRSDVDALARGLQELGACAGDVVAIQLPNCWELLTLHLAVATAGAVMMPIHQGNGPADVHALLDRAQPVVFVRQKAAAGESTAVDYLLSAVPSLRAVLVGGGRGEEPGALSVGWLAAAWAGSAPRPADLRPESPFVLIPSSGTTSARPKICLHNHDGLLSNTYHVAEEGADAFSGPVVTACPMTHLFGLQAMHAALFRACPQVLLRSWDPAAFCDLAREVRPSLVYAVPTQLHDVVAELAGREGPAGFSPREVRTAGAAISEALAADVRAALGTRLVVVWGMSEVGTGTCTHAADPAGVAARSIGRPTRGASVRVVDEDGADCPPGVPGRFWYRSPGMFLGYHREPEQTAEAVTEDGWLRTGDMASLGPDGRVSFHGRSAELINVGGRKFNATEIQDLLAGLPGIGPLAVVGKPDDRLGEYPCLVVTDRAGPAVTLDAVTGFLREQGVADFKIPLELVVLPELPRTSVGKLHRRALEEMLAAGSPAAAPGRARPRHLAEALDLVRTCLARVLGTGEAPVGPEEEFRGHGLDSVRAIRLRNLLAEATGLPLPVSLAYDHPSPLAVARVLVGQVDPAAAPAAAPVPDEPIAVVGMACRLPGGVHGPGDLWRLLADGGDAIGPFPGDRGWDLARLLGGDLDLPGTSATGEGGFLDDAGHFDAGFFGFSDREALATDPQQRLLLETAWEALEDARIAPGSLRGSRTGVFAGAMYHDYAAGAVPGDLEGLLGIGTAGAALAGRVSYTFGFEGPAVTLDTACSSSLVALHLACRSLRSGESSLALAGGVTVMATPAAFTGFSRLRGLSPGGRCRSFADGADGAAWSEGVGLVVLMRLSDALRDGRRVLAVVKGTAVNQDGVSNGLTAPNGSAQRRVVELALADAGLAPADVDAVEAHGTGTALGDPIEAHALIAAYGRGREEPLLLGSVKSNIGHTQAAAGVVGVVKTVLALRHGVLPRTLHADVPSPHVDWAGGAVRLLTEAHPWPRRADRVRRAGVSSFGISGTNAHVILEEAPPEPDPAGTPPAGPVPWVLSGRGEPALRAQARRLAAYVAAHPEVCPRDIAYSLATTRAVHEQRAYVVGADTAELLPAVTALGEGGAIVRSAVRRGALALVFTGQGSQRAGMGQGLARRFPVFRAALDEVCGVMDGLLERPLKEVMWGGSGHGLDRTEYAQPALFAFGVALYRLVESFGVVPGRLVGHSVGEITAAHVSGVLSLPDACTLVAARGRLMGALAPGGAMLAVRMGEDDLAPWLTGQVAIAAVNSPRSTVLSGAEAPLTELAGRLRGAGHRVTRLAVSHAFHSPLMDPMLAEFREIVEGLDLASPYTPVVSCLTGLPLTEAEARDPAHWVRHAREPVRFREAVEHLAGDDVSAFVELGPEAALTPMIGECLPASGPELIAAGGGAEAEEERHLLGAVARLHLHGVPVEWRAVLPRARAVSLPTYAFQRTRYWLTAEPRTEYITAGPAPALVGGDLGDEALLDLVLRETRGVLGGHSGLADAAQPFAEMGVTSVNAIELRDRLIAATGVPLPATLIYDHPTPAALVRLLRRHLSGAGQAPRTAADVVAELDALLTSGAELDPDTAARLRELARRGRPTSGGSSGGFDLAAASDDDLFRLVDSPGA